MTTSEIEQMRRELTVVRQTLSTLIGWLHNELGTQAANLLLEDLANAQSHSESARGTHEAE